MSAIGDLVTYLRGQSAVTALTGSGGVQRWPFPASRAYPIAAVRGVAESREYSDDGPTGLVTAQIDVECWVENNDSGRADALADAVRLALFNKRNETIGSTRFQTIVLDDVRDDVEDARPNSFARVLEFSAAYEETTL